MTTARRLLPLLAAYLLPLPSAATTIYRCPQGEGETPIYQLIPCDTPESRILEHRPTPATTTPKSSKTAASQLLKDADKRLANTRKQASKKTAKKSRPSAAEAKTARCDKLLAQIETIDSKLRQRSTPSLRKQKDRLRKQHSQLGCSLFSSKR